MTTLLRVLNLCMEPVDLKRKDNTFAEELSKLKMKNAFARLTCIAVLLAISGCKSAGVGQLEFRREARAGLVNPMSNPSPPALTQVQQAQSSGSGDATQNVWLASGNTLLGAGNLDPNPVVKVADFIEVFDDSEPSL